MRNEAKLACEENHFSPLITHSSPSSSARVTNAVGSEPPCGSVIEKHDTISLREQRLEVALLQLVGVP